MEDPEKDEDEFEDEEKEEHDAEEDDNDDGDVDDGAVLGSGGGEKDAMFFSGSNKRAKRVGEEESRDK